VFSKPLNSMFSKPLNSMFSKPKWWNGRHGALKMLCSKGRAGSSPAFGTRATLRQIAEGLTPDGVPTARGGSQWRTSSVQGLLASVTGKRMMSEHQAELQRAQRA
jgi:hypothetical protein